MRAAAAVANRDGYPATTADAISREAKMSKATFYVHFKNKEACFAALVEMATQRALEALVASARAAGTSTAERQRGGLRAFLQLLADEPVVARATLVEAVNAGPAARAARDALVSAFAAAMFEETERGATQLGGRRFATRYDALGVVGAVVELSARHLQGGEPSLTEISTTIERMLFGILVDDPPRP